MYCPVLETVVSQGPIVLETTKITFSRDNEYPVNTSSSFRSRQELIFVDRMAPAFWVPEKDCEQNTFPALPVSFSQ